MQCQSSSFICLNSVPLLISVSFTFYPPPPAFFITSRREEWLKKRRKEIQINKNISLFTYSWGMVRPHLTSRIGVSIPTNLRLASFALLFIFLYINFWFSNLGHNSDTVIFWNSKQALELQKIGCCGEPRSHKSLTGAIYKNRFILTSLSVYVVLSFLAVAILVFSDLLFVFLELFFFFLLFLIHIFFFYSDSFLLNIILVQNGIKIG